MDNSKYKSSVTNAFNEMAAMYDDIFTSGPLKILECMVFQTLEDNIPSQPCKILDAGGGTGRIGLHFALKGHNVTVLDISEAMLEVGRKIVTEINTIKGSIEFLQGDIEEMKMFPDEKYDFIIMEGSVVSFLVHPKVALKEIYRVLSPNGKVMFSAQNRFFFMYLAPSFKIMKSIMNTGRVYPHLNDGSNHKCGSHCFFPDDFKTLITQSNFNILKIGSRFMFANRLKDKTAKLDEDPNFFTEVLQMEMEKQWDANFMNWGRVLVSIAEKSINQNQNKYLNY